MAIRIRRGLEADRLSVTPEEGEFLYTTDDKLLYIGDGVTAGGNPITGASYIDSIDDTADIDLTVTGSELTADLTTTAVTPGAYTNADITVDSKGRITAAANGAGGSAVWGGITGTLSDQTDLQSALDAIETLANDAQTDATQGIADAATAQGTANTALTNAATAQSEIDTHEALTNNPHSVTKTQVGLSNVPNTDCTTTANITDSTNKRFITDAQQTVLGNTSGTNTGNETAASIGAIVNGATNYTTPLDADKMGIWDAANSLFKAVTWANIKATLKTYFDTLYQAAGSYVSTSRTLTINGTAHDLSADRSWTVSGSSDIVGKDATQNTLTGTGTETIMATITIPANTFAVGDGFLYTTWFTKSAQTANDTWRIVVYLNAASTLDGNEVQIITSGSLGNTIRLISIIRTTPVITGATSMQQYNQSSFVADDSSTSANTFSNVTIPSITSTMYLLVTAQHNGASTADTIQHRKTVLYKQ